MTQQLVRDWMTPDPVTVGPKTTIPEANRMMREGRFRRLPVVEGGQLIGIVTLGDVREASPSEATTLSVYEMHYLLSTLTVDQIMTREPVTVAPELVLTAAAKLMLEHKIGGLPVVADGRVVGIITESDIFRALVRQLGP